MHKTDSTAGVRPFWFAALATLFLTLVRFYFNRHIDFCGTPDSCSYLALGESLSQHHGFLQNFLYQYQFLSPHIPSHGIEYWRPGTSFFLLLAQPFGGVTLRSSQTVTTLAAILLALAAWHIAMDWCGDRRAACASYVLCLSLPPVWVGSTTPDSAIYYGIFAAWFFVFFTVRFRSYWHEAAAWVCVAGVNLVRNDAILLLVPLLTVLLLRRRKASHTQDRRGSSNAYLLLAVTAFFAAMLPMNLLDFLVLHKAFPPGTGGAIYLTDLSDLMLYKTPLNLHTLLAVGMGRLIRMRVSAVPMIVYRIFFVLLGYGALFFPLLALRDRSRRRASMPELAGSLAFFGTIVAVYGLVLPAIGTFSALRSFIGLLPLSAVLMVASIRWIASAEVFDHGAAASWLTASLAVFYCISGVMQDRRSVEEMSRIADRDHRVAAYLRASGATPDHGALVMTGDSAAFYVTTGYSTIPIPNDNLAMMAQATQDLGATHILIDQDAVAASENEIAEKLHPLASVRIPQTHMLVLTMR